MIRLLFLFAILAVFAAASDSGRLYTLYQNGEYQKACDEGVAKLNRHKKDEKYISLYAFSCLQADKIDRLALPIIMLKNSKEARKNAAYFSTILLQKNLLIDSLENHQDISGLNLPATDYVLSKAFTLYVAQQYVFRNNVYILTDVKNPRQTYRLYLRKSQNAYALVIDEYYDTILTKHHIYR